MLRRIQRVGTQEIAALWPDMQAPRTPSRTADWLEVAADCLEAWKGSAARAGARRALEFAKAWYPSLNLAQLATFQEEAATELARLREENAALREQAERGAMEGATLREENKALAQRAAAAERDGSVLKRGVMVQQRRYEEMERAAAATKKKVAELEMANYALGVRLRDAEASRFPAAYRGPDVF